MRTKGFTVIELLIVVALLGILATIVMPKFIGQDVTAKQKKVLADLATIDAALQLYYSDNGSWPAAGSSLSFLAASGYLAAVPVPPAVTTNFNVGTTYSLGAVNSGTSYQTYRGTVSFSGAWRNGSDSVLSGW